MDKSNRLIIPSCAGLLDCFNTRLSKYQQESLGCLQDEIDNLLLLGLFSYIYVNADKCIEPCSYTFKMADFKRYLGYTGGGKSKDLHTELLELEQGQYRWNGGIHVGVVNVSFNATKTKATIESEYFTKVIQSMRIFSGKRNKWGKKTGRGKSIYSSMVYTTILKERNIPAVEISIEFVRLIERRGPLKQGEFAHISTKSLIERCPFLSNQIEKAKETKERNRILRTAISKSLELLRTQTDIYQSFVGLEFHLPEQSSVSKESVIKIMYEERIFENEKVL